MTTTSTSKPAAENQAKKDHNNSYAAFGIYLKEMQFYPSSSLKIEGLEWWILMLIPFVFLVVICRRSRFSMKSPLNHVVLAK